MTIEQHVHPKFNLSKVEKAFQVKFGSAFVLFEEQKDGKGEVIRLNDKEVVEGLKEKLNKSMLFKSVEIVKLSDGSQFWEGYFDKTRRSVNFYPPIQCTLSIPIKNQEERQFFKGLFGETQIDETSDFGMFYNGSVYITYREINLHKLFHPGALDVRDLFEETIKDTSKWVFEYVPPNPLRQDFFFYFVKTDEETTPFIGKDITINSNTVFIRPTPKDLDFAKVIGLTFAAYSHTLDTYYKTMLQKGN